MTGMEEYTTAAIDQDFPERGLLDELTSAIHPLRHRPNLPVDGHESACTRELDSLVFGTLMTLEW